MKQIAGVPGKSQWEIERDERLARMADPATSIAEMKRLFDEQVAAERERLERLNARSALRERFSDFKTEMRQLEYRFPGLEEDPFWLEIRQTLTRAYEARKSELEG